MRLRDVERFYNEAKQKLYASLEFETKRLQNLHEEKMETMRREIKKLAEDVTRTDREARAEQYGKIVEIRAQVSCNVNLCRSLLY